MSEVASNAQEDQDRALRAAVYARFPEILSELRETFSQLHSIARTYSSSQNYDLTSRALVAIAHLLVQYLVLRNETLVMPTSYSAMLGDLAPPHDAFLVEQLESIAALHKWALKNSDVELSRQITNSLRYVAIHGLKITTYSQVPGENNIVPLILAYLYPTIEQATLEKLHDVTLNGCRVLSAIGNAATSRRLHFTNRLIAADLEKLASLCILQRKSFLTREAVRGIAEMTAVAIFVSLARSHTIRNALDALKRIAIQELSVPKEWVTGPLDLQNALGPFLDLVTETSVARLEALAIDRFMSAEEDKDANKIADAEGIIEELNDRLWVLFADLGVAAAKTESFALHFINANISEIANQQLSLYAALQEREFAGMDRWQQQRFAERLLRNFRWLISAVHWRIYDAFESQVKTDLVWEFFKTLSQVGIRCIEMDLSEEAIAVIHQLCSLAKKALQKQLEHGYGPPRIAEHIGRIGIIARKRNRLGVLRAAINALNEFNREYSEKVRGLPELEHQLLFEIQQLEREWQSRHIILDPDEAYFFSRLDHGDVEAFLHLLEENLGQT